MANKRGQVTIFIIIALVIIAGIAAFLLIKTKAGDNKPTYTSTENPARFIDECVGELVEEKTSQILEQGGFLEPEFYTTFNSTKTTYLCYSSYYYEPCINQKPALMNDIRKEIKNGITDGINECFKSLELDYQDKGITVNSGEVKNVELELNEKIITMSFDKEFIFTKNEELKKYEEFKSSINSPVYRIVRAAIDMIIQESQSCDSNYIEYQVTNPALKIYRIEAVNQTKIYRIIDKSSSMRMNFAIKGCTIAG